MATWTGDRSVDPHMPIETFPLHFEGCEHVPNIPLVHNSDHSLCYLCHPELHDRPVTGKCPECTSEAASRAECLTGIQIGGVQRAKFQRAKRAQRVCNCCFFFLMV